jgi:hypothetical protein
LPEGAKRGDLLGHLYRYPHPRDASKFIYSGQGEKRDVEHRSARTSFGRRFRKQFPGVELSQPIREVVEVENQLELNELETIWMFRYHIWYGYEGGMNLIFPGGLDYKSIGQIGGRTGGHIGGRRTFENGTGLFAMTLKQKSVASREGGRISGRKNVESGQLDHIRNLPQTRTARAANGHKMKARGRGIFGFSHDQRVETARVAGCIGGRRNVESGQLASVRTSESCSRGGQTGGRIAAENGRLDSMRTFETCSKGGRIGGRLGMCRRWNINRGKPCVCGKHQAAA